jgi:hypothetical protein
MQVLSYHEAWHLRQVSKRELMFKTMVADRVLVQGKYFEAILMCAIEELEVCQIR